MGPKRILAVVCLGVILAVSARAAPTEVKVGGSGGALGVMRALGEAFSKQIRDVAVRVLPSLGSEGGVKAVLSGAIDMAVICRPLRAGERARGLVAKEMARTPFVFAVTRNISLNGLTLREVASIYAGRMQRWPDGSRIRLVLRPAGDSDSDLIKSISPELSKSTSLAEGRPGMLLAVTDQDCAEDIERIAGAFGPSTLGLIVSEGRALKPLALDGVEPTAKALADGRYRYFKSYILVTGSNAVPAARAFAEFAVSEKGRAILSRNGYAVEPPAGRP